MKPKSDERKDQNDSQPGSHGSQQKTYNNTQSNSQDAAPRNQQYQNFGNSDPFEKSGQPIDISDDDLPF